MPAERKPYKCSPSEDTEVTVFHDGGCPLCRAEVKLMRKLDQDNRVNWVDIDQHKPVLERDGFTYKESMERIHVRQRDGTMATGVEGFMVVWRGLRGYRHLASMFDRFPLLLKLMRGFYWVFAKVRTFIYRRRIANHNESLG